MCLKKGSDAGKSFSTHFHVTGQIRICWGLTFLMVFNSLNLVNLLLIVIHNFLTLKCGGDLGMLNLLCVLLFVIHNFILINQVV